MKKSSLRYGAVVIGLLLIGVVIYKNKSKSNESEAQVESQEVVENKVDSIPPLGFWEDSLVVVENKVKKSEFFIPLLVKLGMQHQDAVGLCSACDTIFDVRKLRAGNPYKAYYEKKLVKVGNDLQEAEGKLEKAEKGGLKYFVYQEDKLTSVVFNCQPPYDVYRVKKEVTRERDYVDVTINSSMWNDIVAAGRSPKLVLSLSDVYAWTIDFFSLQKGDRFRVLYDKLLCEGEFIGIDTLYYSVFTHRGEDYDAIMFNQGDNGNLYWNEKGESMRKAFLKAPLTYRRISSKFTYNRKHPVTGVVRPHTGVDYAAPMGTPVVAVADGTVLSAGWAGGGGKSVKIRHNSVYTTMYMHLSKYGKGIKSGVRVRQGQVIGYVGSTGMSTGPHLDYRIWKNGTPINSLTLVSPPSEPVKQENMHAFDSIKVHYQHLADSLSKTLN